MNSRKKMTIVQSQMQLERDQQISTMKEVVLMFRDQIGTIISQTERFLFSLGALNEKEFKFHGYSPERLIESNPEFIALKLALSYKNLSSYYGNMSSDFSDYPTELRNEISMNISSAFQFRIGDLQDYLAARVSRPKNDPIIKLVETILDNLQKKEYKPLDPQMLAVLKSKMSRESSTVNKVESYQNEMLKHVHQAQTIAEETGEYMQNTKNRPVPDSAYQPATRADSQIRKAKPTYVDINPKSQVQKFYGGAPANYGGVPKTQTGVSAAKPTIGTKSQQLPNKTTSVPPKRR